MSTDANKAAATRVLEEFFSAGRLDLAEELFAPGLVSRHPDEPYETRGPDGMRARITAWRTAFPDLTTPVLDMVAEGDRVAIRSAARGTHRGPFGDTPPTGRAIDVAWSTIYRFEGGQVAETWDTWNELEVTRQLGLAQTAEA